MLKMMLTNNVRRTMLFALVTLAPCIPKTGLGQALNMDGQSRYLLPTVG